MTRAPYLLPSGRFGARMGDARLIDSMLHDGLWDAAKYLAPYLQERDRLAASTR
jgi:acetyl-CoA acetyltransferase